MGDAPRPRAAIDIGTNSVLLLVARVREGGLERLEDRATITRLGQGVDRTGRLAPEAITRTLDCLRDYAERLRAHDVESLRVVATSAARDAENREELLGPARELLGVELEAISGDAEARLTFRGATLGLSLDPTARALVFDVGGGSTEVIASGADGATSLARSLDVGAVRLTERHVRHDPPTEAELTSLRAAADAALSSLGPAPDHDALVGIAGTVTTLAAIRGRVAPYDPSVIHGASLSRLELQDLARTLASLPSPRRAALPGLDPKRADVIVAGAVIVSAVMDWAGRASLIVSDGGVRVGLLLTP